MALTYHSINLQRLAQLGDKTKAKAMQFYNYCVENDIDILVVETIRTLEKQKEYYNAKKSQTLKSYHLVGQALDVVPIINRAAVWDAYGKEPFASAIRYAKKCGFEWGGDWVGAWDKPHLQYASIGYGNDTFNTRGEIPNVCVPTPKKGTLEKGDKGEEVKEVQKLLNAKGAKLVVDGDFGEKTDAAVRDFQAKNGLFVDGIVGEKTLAKLHEVPKPTYKIGVITGDVWLHFAPNFDNSSRERVLKEGESYKVYGEVNGMYAVGGYVSKKYVKIVG